MKRLSLIFVVLAALGWSAPVWAQNADACKPPYKPNNIFKLLVNYTPTLEWIAQTPDSCGNRSPFTQSLKKLVSDTWVMTQGCIDVTIEDIELAEKQRKVATKMSKRERAIATKKSVRVFPASPRGIPSQSAGG